MTEVQSAIDQEWRRRYAQLIAALPERIGGTAPLVCGFSVCIDVRVSCDAVQLRRIEEGAESSSPSVRALSTAILGRLHAGRGGELETDTAGVAWLTDAFDGEPVLGGTSAHVSRAYAQVGAPAAMALRDRSAAQLDLLPDDLQVIDDDGAARSAREITPRGSTANPFFVLEFTQGTPMRDGVVQRSTRIIVVTSGRQLDFTDNVLRYAEQHENYGLLASGFQTMDAEEWPEARERVLAIARRANGLRHHEVAEYQSIDFFRTTITDLAPAVPSLGMSLSELDLLAPGDRSPVHRAAALAGRLGLERICVHADGGAFTVTKNDPVIEEEALLTGCLFAANRAAHGPGADLLAEPVAAAQFVPVPGVSSADDLVGYSLVSVVSPYLEHPRTTLGLGDTFVAGTALILNTAPSTRSQI